MKVEIKELDKGIRKFKQNEPRDAIYNTATFLVEHFWRNFQWMADGLGVLLVTWNSAFYRYGYFDLKVLEKTLKKNIDLIEYFRSSDISKLDYSNEIEITKLFNAILKATSVTTPKKGLRHSPVGTVKAMHLLAPNYFPLWDKAIADAYDCNYSSQPAAKYLKFMHQIQAINGTLPKKYLATARGSLKVIDEYNYAKYTQGWI